MTPLDLAPSEQGRDLPAADSNGLMDPYLALRCGGQELNTETYKHLGKAIHRRRKTVDPMWYFTWEADLSLPSDDLQGYFPQVMEALGVMHTGGRKCWSEGRIRG